MSVDGKVTIAIRGRTTDASASSRSAAAWERGSPVGQPGPAHGGRSCEGLIKLPGIELQGMDADRASRRRALFSAPVLWSIIAGCAPVT